MLGWDLQTLAAITGILGVSIFSVVWVGWVFANRLFKRRKLEAYLLRKKRGGELYQHTLDHLILNTKLTRDEIERASFSSKKIKRIARQDAKGMATGYLLEYDGDD